MGRCVIFNEIETGENVQTWGLDEVTVIQDILGQEQRLADPFCGNLTDGKCSARPKESTPISGVDH